MQTWFLGIARCRPAWTIVLPSFGRNFSQSGVITQWSCTYFRRHEWRTGGDFTVVKNMHDKAFICLRVKSPFLSKEWVWAHLEMGPCSTSGDCRGWAGAGRETVQHPVCALLLLAMNLQATILLSKICSSLLLLSVCQGAPLFFSIMNISLSLSLNYMIPL